MHKQMMNREDLCRKTPVARILHIVGDSKYGGGSVLIQRFAIEALGCGHDVSVLTTDPTFQKQLMSAGVGIVNLDCIWRPIRPLRDIRGLIKLWRYLSRNQFDIVHTHTSKAGFVGRLAARWARVPVIIHTVHGFAFHEASSRPALLVYSQLERIAANFCDALVAVSNYHCDWAARLRIGNEHTRVAIPNGIDPARIQPSRGRDAVRSELGVSNEEIMCLATGRLAKGKGLDLLLQGLAARRSDKPLKVFLAGDGEEREELKELAVKLNIQQIVTFLGFRNDLGDLLAATDMVLLPSLREGLSISLLEAMAAGKAIITTDIGSNLEVTRHGEAAWIVTAGSVDNLADAIVRLAADKGERDRLGRVALATFQGSYHENIMLDRYMVLYARLVNEKCGNKTKL